MGKEGGKQMRINEIIRERRLAENLTQEQVALRLGVTAPAVNKWEKGTSYPDITLLPALARLLKTDLNTLLSFKDDLSVQEIQVFMNELTEMSEKDGFETAYRAGMEKIREYPNCEALILNTALIFDGSLVLNPKAQENEKYRASIEALYERAAAGADPFIGSQARSALISKYIGRKEYDRAEALLEELPEKNPVDKKQIQINLLIAQEKFAEAARLEEEKLLSASTEMYSLLLTLMEIALKEERMDDAEYIAEVSKKGAALFDLWEYMTYAAHFQLYSARKERVKCLKVLVPMLKSLTRKWELNRSPLYRHIKTKKVETDFGPKLQKAIIASVSEDKDMEFLKGVDNLEELL